MLSFNPKHYSYQELKDYLINKNNHYSKKFKAIKTHLNKCKKCWDTWNKIRWDKALKSKEIKELKNYLGSEFVPYYDSSWNLAKTWNQLKPISEAEVNQFYKINNDYLYNLTLWKASGDRKNFEADIKKIKAIFKIRSIIDYGCGTGSDALMFLKNNLKTYLIDLDCPSFHFLKWRLKKRKINTPVLDAEKIDKLPDADVFWAIDVLEHMLNPLQVLNMLSPQTKLFIHRSEFGNTHGGRHPFHFDFKARKFDQALKNKGFEKVKWPVLSVWVKK